MTEYEVIEAKLAELYQLQRERIGRLVAGQQHPSDVIREEVAEAREILGLWMCCIEARDRANRRLDGKVKLD